MPDTDNDVLITVDESCVISGDISRPTYYRAVKAGYLPAPIHPTKGTSRIWRSQLVAALRARGAR